MQKIWQLVSVHREQADQLYQEFNKTVPLPLCKVFLSRNIRSLSDARTFFNPQPEHLHDPFLMKDMDKAVLRLESAFIKKEKILIVGDYDVDGTTAVAIMIRFLHEQYDPALVDFYIPHRHKEGYGISRQAVEHAHKEGYQLMISVDCGIKSHQLVALAKSYGIDFIICDHHQPDQLLPPAIAILNPQQPGCPYPFKDLCGCGVAFKFISAYMQQHHKPFESYAPYLDLVATAIAADIVSMTGENRVLASLGLQRVNSSPNYGITALLELAGKQGPIDIENLVFVIAPRVNAAGRMDDARKAVEMFIAPTLETARAKAALLHDNNIERKEKDQSITLEALEKLHNDPDYPSKKSTVVYADHWHKGVVGIVASRLIEHHYKPTIVLTRSGDVITGSARSVAGFNIHNAIDACSDLLVGFGGHFHAAGLTMRPEQLPEFVQQFEAVVQRTISPDSLQPVLWLDGILHISDITPRFIEILSRMEPFGPGNQKPVWWFKNVQDHGSSRIVKDEHIRFEIWQDQFMMTGIGFKLKHKWSVIESGQPFDLAAAVTLNEWNGKIFPQLYIYDIKLTMENG